MTLVKGAFPYDVANLLGGKVRVLIADLSAVSPPAVPVKLNDVIKLETPYEPKVAGWVDLGAARDSSSYSRSFASEGYEIQQVSSAVLQDVTGVARSVSVSIAEISPAGLLIVEQSPGTEAVAKSAGQTAQTGVPFGEITDFKRYRVALIAQRKRQSGVVKEKTGSKERGRFVGITLNEVTISADETGIEFDKGTLTHVPLTFTAYPAPGEEEGEEYGRWLVEEAGTME